MINRFYYWKILIQLFSVVHVRKNDTKVQYLSCKCSSLVIGGPQSNKIRGRKCAPLLLHLFLITFSKRWLALPSSCKNKSGAEIKSSALCSAVRLLQTECQDHTCLGPGNSPLCRSLQDLFKWQGFHGTSSLTIYSKYTTTSL